MVRLREARQLQPGASRGRSTTTRRGSRGCDAHKLALYERPALDLEAQPDEERRHRVEVRDGDADMVETSYVRHEVHPPDLLVSLASPVEALTWRAVSYTHLTLPTN